MILKALAAFRKEPDYVVDEADLESLGLVLGHLQEAFTTLRESGRLTETHPLWKEERAVLAAYYGNPTVQKELFEALRPPLADPNSLIGNASVALAVAPPRQADAPPPKINKYIPQ